jgi:hypothetical protein
LSPTIDKGGKPQINVKGLWQTADHREKPVCTILPASPVGEQTGGEKLTVLQSPCQALVKLFSSGADRMKLKSGVGIQDIN